MLLLWSVYGCNNWKLIGEAVDGENDLTSYITTILNELYVANCSVTGNVQWATSTSASLAYTWPSYVQWKNGYQVAAFVRQRETNCNPTTSSIDFAIDLNPNVDWYRGIDGNPSSSQYDLVTILLHEVHHGIGFASGYDENGGEYYPGNLFDTGLPPDAPSLFTSGDLIWNGYLQLYAPSQYDPGVSVMHTDPNRYGGTADCLMCPFVNPGEVIHNPGPNLLRAMQLLGWTLQPNASALLKNNHNIYSPGNWWSREPLWQKILFVSGMTAVGSVLIFFGITCSILKFVRKPNQLPDAAGLHAPQFA